MTGLVGEGLLLRRGGRAVLEGVDLDLDRGELVLLAGRNGAGKSTLLRLLLGVEPPEAGRVTLDGRLLSLWDPLARAREMAFVQQSAECPFEFTGRELVTMARESCRKMGKLADSWHRCKACGKEAGSKHTTEADSELALNGHLTSKSMHELRSFGPRSDDRIHPSPSMYLQLKATWKEGRRSSWLETDSRRPRWCASVTPRRSWWNSQRTGTSS